MKDLLLHPKIVRFSQIIIRFSIAKLPFPQQSSSFSSTQNYPQPVQQPYNQPIPSIPSFPLPKTIINVKNIANFASKAISISNFQRERTNPKPFVCHFNTFRGQILTFEIKVFNLMCRAIVRETIWHACYKTSISSTVSSVITLWLYLYFLLPVPVAGCSW